MGLGWFVRPKMCVCTKMYEAPSANRVCGSHWAAASACSEVLFSTLSTQHSVPVVAVVAVVVVLNKFYSAFL